MDDTVDIVCRAINIFYTGGTDSQQAQIYLRAFQDSPDSWTICDLILNRHNDSLACYFAAQTLRSNILKKFNQLPSESHGILKNSLLQHLNRHGAMAHDQQSEATSTQLCLAIADLYIQIPTWNNWIFELLNQCQSLEGDRTIMTLTLLQVFPEEVEEIRGIGENRRNTVRNELATCEEHMIQFLAHVVAKFSNNFEILKRVLKCLESNLLNKYMLTDSFARSPLIQLVFQILASDSSVPSSLHEAATNVVIASFYRAEETDKHEKLAQILQQGVVQLVQPFKSAEQSEDLDRIQNIARLFVEMGESFYIQIVNETEETPQKIGGIICLELLLLVASHHDYTLIEMTFNVWYRLTEELFKYDDDMYISKFKPYANKFIMALYEHCKMDPDDIDDIVDEKTEFGEFRLKAIEAVRDVVFIIQTDQCIEAMHQKLLECVSKQNGSWEESEAAIFMMASVVQNLLPEADSRLGDVLNMICHLPIQSPPQLIITSLTLIADSNDWLEGHKNCLGPIIKWVFQFAIDTRYSQYVANCIDRITLRCTIEMIPLLSDMMNLIHALEHSTQGGAKVEEAICSITRAVSLILTKLPPAEAKIGMERLCEPIIRNLTKTIDMTDGVCSTSKSSNGCNKENENIDQNILRSSGAWSTIATRPLLWVDRLSYVFKDVWKPPTRTSPQQIAWLDIAAEFVKVLIRGTKKFEGNSRICEHSVRAIRLIFRSLGDQSFPLVEPVVQMLIETYPKNKHSSLLYLASVVVDEYGNLDSMRPGLLHMLETLSNCAFELFRMSSGCLHHPDTVDDLYRLASRFCARATSAFFMHPISEVLFTVAVSNLTLDHGDANKSLTKFLVEVVEQLNKARRMNYSDAGVVAAQNLVDSQAVNMIATALNSACFHVTGNLRRDMAEIICLLGKYDKYKYKDWVTRAIAILPNDEMKATPAQLTKFVESVDRDREAHLTFNHLRDLVQLFN